MKLLTFPMYILMPGQLVHIGLKTSSLFQQKNYAELFSKLLLNIPCSNAKSWLPISIVVNRHVFAHGYKDKLVDNKKKFFEFEDSIEINSNYGRNNLFMLLK